MADGAGYKNKTDEQKQSLHAAAELYNKTQEREKELRSLLKKKNILDKSLLQLRNSIRDGYESILFLNYEYALSKEVEQHLWKTVFYKVIEEYRKRLRKNLPNAQKGEKPASREDLQRTCESFKSFLNGATKFYQDLITKFQTKFNLKLDGSDENYTEDGTVHKSLLSCHRCLIFLGDLARYHRDLYGHSARKEWTKAADYYQKALQLVPDNGNPHNQLAVLATYVDDEFNAVYHYFRSLAVTHPFLTAKENLTFLFEKNRLRNTALDEGKESDGERPSSQDSDGQFVVPKQVKNFLTRFIRLHGILYTKTSIEKFEATRRSVLSSFESLLQQQVIPEDIVLKMFALNMFSVHNIASSSGQTYAEISQKTILSSHAVSLMFDCASSVFSASSVLLSAEPTNAPQYLGPIGIFLEFLMQSPQYTKKPTEDVEVKAWQNMCRELAELLNSVNMLEDIDDVDPNEVLLSEEVELRGFLPLQEAHKDLCFSAPPPDNRDAHLKRLKKIRDFGTFATSRSETPKMLYYNREQAVYSDKPVFKLQQQQQTSPPQKKPMLNGDTKILKHTPQSQPQAHPQPAPVPAPASTLAPAPQPAASKVQQAPIVPAAAPRSSDSMDIEKLSLEDEPEDDVDDEVILFRPGEGTKLEPRENNIKTANSTIGSGRSEKSPEDTSKFSTGFDLFGGSNHNNHSLFSNFQFPLTAQEQQSKPKQPVQQNTLPFSPVMFDPSSFNVNPLAESSSSSTLQHSSSNNPILSNYPFGSPNTSPPPTPSIWTPPPFGPIHSFFTTAPSPSSTSMNNHNHNHATSNGYTINAEPKSPNGIPMPWFSPQNSTSPPPPPQSNVNQNMAYNQFAPSPFFPFPGGQQSAVQPPRTKNPFIG